MILLRVVHESFESDVLERERENDLQESKSDLLESNLLESQIDLQESDNDLLESDLQEMWSDLQGND